MGFKENITLIKDRIGIPTIDRLFDFVSGYIYNDSMNNRMDDFEKWFRDSFSIYVCKFLRDINPDLEYDDYKTYADYISEVYDDESKRIDLFFKIFEIFYLDYKSRF